MATASEATLQELARLCLAFMQSRCPASELFDAAVLHSQRQAMHLPPGELALAAFAFGQCFEAADVVHLPHLRAIFQSLRQATISSLPLFRCKDLVSMMHTFARWQISIEGLHLESIARRMYGLRAQFDAESAATGLYSLALLMQRNAEASAHRERHEVAWKAAYMAGQALFGPTWRAARNG